MNQISLQLISWLHRKSTSKTLSLKKLFLLSSHVQPQQIHSTDWLPKYKIAYILWLHSHWRTLQGHWSKALLHAITRIQENWENSSALFSTWHIKESFLCKQNGDQIAKIILIKIIFLSYISLLQHLWSLKTSCSKQILLYFWVVLNLAFLKSGCFTAQTEPVTSSVCLPRTMAECKGANLWKNCCKQCASLSRTEVTALFVYPCVCSFQSGSSRDSKYSALLTTDSVNYVEAERSCFSYLSQ